MRSLPPARHLTSACAACGTVIIAHRASSSSRDSRANASAAKARWGSDPYCSCATSSNGSRDASYPAGDCGCVIPTRRRAAALDAAAASRPCDARRREFPPKKECYFLYGVDWFRVSSGMGFILGFNRVSGSGSPSGFRFLISVLS